MISCVTHFILETVPQGRFCFQLYFIDGETKVQRDGVMIQVSFQRSRAGVHRALQAIVGIYILFCVHWEALSRGKLLSGFIFKKTPSPRSE